MRFLCLGNKIIFRTALWAVSAIGVLTAAPVANGATSGSVAYTYDALGRVTTASYDTGVCIVYSYDANGNRLSETINVTTSGTTGVWGCFNWNDSGGQKWGP
jgi:YD repeat-containing protein